MSKTFYKLSGRNMNNVKDCSGNMNKLLEQTSRVGNGPSGAIILLYHGGAK